MYKLLLTIFFNLPLIISPQEISFDFNNPNLEVIISEIESQTDLKFAYGDDVNLTTKLVGKFSFEKENLDEVLKQLSGRSPYNMSIRGNNIAIYIDSSVKKSKFEKAKIEKAKIQFFVVGNVTDKNGLPIPSVTVQEQGTRNGVLTDFDGNFSIKVGSDESVLVFTFIGMQSLRKTVAGNTTMNIQMQEDEQALDEIVVVGYGTQRRSEVTGSISNVAGEAVAELPVQSFESALNGRATGVNITANAGVLNSAPVFRIRGTNSLSLSSYPLIVVDGVPMFTSENESSLGYASTNPLSSINPSDIESIDIAKDAAATSIYGSRAANGVVFITTKKGKRGAATVSLESWIGFTSPNKLPDVLNAAEYIEIKNEGLRNEGTYDPVSNYYDYSLDANGNPIDTDWSDYIYQTGISHNNNLSISGATELTRYYGSVGYTEQEGIFKENTFDRKSVLFNISNNTTSWLEVGAKVNYINENNASAMATGKSSATATGAMARLDLMTAPIASPYNNDGTFNNTSSGFIGLQDNFGHLKQSRLGFTNPVLSMKHNYSNNNVDHVQSNAFVTVKPT